MGAAELKHRLLTREEYHRAAEAGIYRPDEKLELIAGEVVEKMSPQGWPHSGSLVRGRRALEPVFGAGHTVLVQSPLAIDAYNEPEPDLLVITGIPDDYEDHPTPADTALLVEVADTTLLADRRVKGELYARTGIADYWIVNLPDRRLEVYRGPEATGGRWAYQTCTILGEDDAIAPLAAPGASIRVATLLPPERQ